MASIRSWGKVLAAALCSKSNQDFYDRISPVYDQCFVTHRLHAINMAELLFERCKGREKDTLVLDLGCGTGLLSGLVAGKGFEVVGMDVSLESLRMLRQNAPGIRAVQADASLLPVTEAACHAVVSLGAWRHFPNPRQVMAEVARILKDDGLLIVGYFPPAVGGVIQQGDSLWRKMLVRVYQFLVRKRGYVDHVDPSLESLTVGWAKDHFEQVSPVVSGEHWRLIIAQGLRRA